MASAWNLSLHVLIATSDMPMQSFVGEVSNIVPRSTILSSSYYYARGGQPIRGWSVFLCCIPQQTFGKTHIFSVISMKAGALLFRIILLLYAT
jgi:hypothetical protein